MEIDTVKTLMKKRGRSALARVLSVRIHRENSNEEVGGQIHSWKGSNLQLRTKDGSDIYPGERLELELSPHISGKKGVFVSGKVRELGWTRSHSIRRMTDTLLEWQPDWQTNTKRWVQNLLDHWK